MLRVLLVVALLWPSLSRADDENEAREHYTRATAAFRNGDYDTAVDEYQQSLLAQQRTTTLYNLALAAERAHRDDIAANAFRRYLALETQPPAKQSSYALGYLRAWEVREQQRREAEAVKRDRLISPSLGSVETPPPPPRPSSRAPAIAALSLLAIGVVSGAAGAGVLGHSLSIDVRGSTLGQHYALVDQVTTEQRAGWSLAGIGIAVGVGSAASFGVWLYRRRGGG